MTWLDPYSWPAWAPLALILFSAVVHAAVNAFQKRSTDPLMFRCLIGVGQILTLIWAVFLVPLPDAPMMMWLAMSVAVHLLYQLFLSRAYVLADMSAVYPVARGLSPLLAGIGAFVFYGESLGPGQIAGLILIAFGLMSFASEKIVDAAHKEGLIFAALTGICIASYTVIDAGGMRAAHNPWSYIVWFFLLENAPLSTWFLIFRRARYIAAWKLDWRAGLTSGFASVLSYGAAMLALMLAGTAEIAALRETSVLFGAVIGVFVLKEAFGLRRILAAAVVVCGVIALKVL
ncbi:MAG: EamA family transporter [Alphaproteobacteria bacterium]